MSTLNMTTYSWLRLVRAEYQDIPGLQLTERDIRRQWGMDPLVCQELLAELTRIGFLKQTGTGRYVRAN